MWRVRDWNERFEGHRTRRCKAMQWLALPAAMDSDGYAELLDHPQGAAHYGAWVALLLAAAKCGPRGTLVREGGRPHDFASLARVTRVGEAVLREALPRLLTVGWLEEVADGPDEAPARSDGAPARTDDAPAVRAACATRQDKTEHDKTEQESPCSAAAPQPAASAESPVLLFPCAGKGPREFPLPQSKIDEYQAAFPGVDAAAECRKALQWCRDNPPRRKTADGMTRFLNRWMNQAQNESSRLSAMPQRLPLDAPARIHGDGPLADRRYRPPPPAAATGGRAAAKEHPPPPG